VGRPALQFKKLNTPGAVRILDGMTGTLVIDDVDSLGEGNTGRFL